MKRLLGLAVLVVAMLLAVGCSHPRAVAYYPPPPPPSLSEVARQGFHDGFAAARHDVRAGAPPDVNRHPRFRNPPVPPPAFADYRRGFRDGYEHFLHPQAPPPGY